MKPKKPENKFKLCLPVVILVCFVLVSLTVFVVVSIALDDQVALVAESEMLRAKAQDKMRVSKPSPLVEQPRVLVLKTTRGDIHIKLRSDLSRESVQHIQQLAENADNCEKCQFYRSEKDLLLQGVMLPKSSIPALAERPPKGKCPPEFANRAQDCPKHDPKCGCHGPTMTKGMVGWAGGNTGPNFFINVYKKPVEWWGQQHTVWGLIEDPKSLNIVENRILNLPVDKSGGSMNMLKNKIGFQMEVQDGTDN